MPILDRPAPVKRRTSPPAISPDLLDRLGGIPVERIRLYPTPGTATMKDVEQAGKACELVDGTLVEKAMEFQQSILAGIILYRLIDYNRQRRLGFVTAPDGGYELNFGQLRRPDVAFVDRSKMPPGDEVPDEHLPELVPDLAVEVLSKSNTKAEMKRKRREYFAAGVKLVWEVDRFSRCVTVYTSEIDFTVLLPGEVVGGGDVLPGFELPVSEIFDELKTGY